LDQRFLEFTGVDPAKLKKQLAAGKGDGEILEWITAHTSRKLTAWEIAQWSALQEQRVPTDVATRQFFHNLHSTVAPKRADIGTWFDLLDLDDYASFGGKP